MRMVSDLDRAQELNRRRIMQARTREELDDFYAQPPAEQRQAGRMTEREYDDFERKRQEKFKSEILERISAGYDSVSAFDISEAEALCLEDPEFKELYLRAKEEYDAHQSGKNKSEKASMPEVMPVVRKRTNMPPRELTPVKQREALPPEQLPEEEESNHRQSRFMAKPITHQTHSVVQPPQMPYILQAPQPNYDSRFNEIDLRFGELSQMISQMQQFMEFSKRNEQEQMIEELQIMRMSQMQPNESEGEVLELQMRIQELEQELAVIGENKTQINAPEPPKEQQEGASEVVDPEISRMKTELDEIMFEKKKLREEIEQIRAQQASNTEIRSYEDDNLTVGVLQERNRLRWEMLEKMERDFE